MAQRVYRYDGVASLPNTRYVDGATLQRGEEVVEESGCCCCCCWGSEILVQTEKEMFDLLLVE